MARKSRKNTADHGNSFMEPVVAVTYRAALYARISVETEEKERLLKAIGFKRTDSGSLEIDLNGFFTDHCHDKK